VDFFSFDAAYVERLAAGDPAVVEHFNSYFEELIFIKLRARQLPLHVIEDVRQETFLRVFQTLRKDGIRQPERIGAFVNSVCNNVVLEFGRAGSRITFMDEAPDAPDSSESSERRLIEQERKANVHRILSEMPAKNQRLLTAVFLDERPPNEVCDEFGVDRGYLRVLLFRARTQLRDAVQKGKRPRRSAGNHT
jgi:RNA polymerase sigma-70 factor (ECF subfamily)